MEKQQNERQRKFSHSRGVAPATQLDYPLFGNGATSGIGGPRRRPMRGRPSAPPPAPTPAPGVDDDEDNKGHRKSVGGVKGVAAPVASSLPLPFPSGNRGGGVGRSGGLGIGDAGGAGGQSGSSWPQKPGPPPWPAEGNSSNSGSCGGGLGAATMGMGYGAGVTPAEATASVNGHGGVFAGGGAMAVPFRGADGGVSPAAGRNGSNDSAYRERRYDPAAPPGAPLPSTEAIKGGGAGAAGLRKRPGEMR